MNGSNNHHLVFGESTPVFSADSELKKGQVHLANSRRIVEDHFDQPLTSYVQGLLDRSTDKSVLDSIAPEVPTSTRFSYEADEDGNYQEFLSLPNDADVRAPLSDFKRIEPTNRKVSAETLNKGLSTRRERSALTAPMARERVIGWLSRILLRMEIKRAFDLWNNASNTNKTWDDSANPDHDLMNLIETSADDSGNYPSFLLSGSGVWPIRYGSLTDPARGFAHPNAAFSQQQLAEFLGVDKIVTLKNRYATKKNATTLSKIASNVVIAGFLEEQPMAEGDASHVKRFVSSDDDGLGAFNEYGLRVFVDESNPKWVDFTVEHNSLIAAPHTKGLVKYTVSSGS